MDHWGLATLKPFCESVATENLARQGFEFYSPQFMERKIVRGRKTYAPTQLFPGYLFVVVADGWRSIFGTKGITALIMDGDVPSRMRSEDISRIKSQEVDGFVVLQDQRNYLSKFKRGDSVEVSSGPMSSRIGIFSGDRKSDRVRVLFKMLGRETSVFLRESDLTPA